MTLFRFEGGPLDGQRLETSGVQIFRVPRPIPWNAPTDLGYSIWEYRRSGSVYRFETLIGDAYAEMSVAAEAFIEPLVRRFVREGLRRMLQDLDPMKDLGAVKWAIGHDSSTAMFAVAAFVGGRRREYAAAYRLDKAAASSEPNI